MDAVARKAFTEARHLLPQTQEVLRGVTEEFIAKVRSKEIRVTTVEKKVVRIVGGRTPSMTNIRPGSSHLKEIIGCTLMRRTAFPRTYLTTTGELVAYPNFMVGVWWAPNPDSYTNQDLNQIIAELREVLENPHKLVLIDPENHFGR